jgi:hypothetical protein
MAIAEIQTLQQGVAQGLTLQAKGTKTQVGHLHHHIPQVIVSTLNILSAHTRIQGGQGTGPSWIQAS